MRHNITTPPDVEVIPSDFNFEDYWVAATFDNFDAYFELSIDLNASSSHNEINVPIPFTKTLSKKVSLLLKLPKIDLDLTK